MEVQSFSEFTRGVRWDHPFASDQYPETPVGNILDEQVQNCSALNRVDADGQ